MKNLMHKVLFPFVFLCLGANLNASNKDKENTNNSNEGFNSVEMIMHHIADSHEWHLWGGGKQSVTIPLPIILFTDGSLTLFMSSEFKHDNNGKVIVEKNNGKFVRIHNKIYKLNYGEYKLNESLLYTDKANAELVQADFSLTKNATSLFVSLTVLLLLFGFVGFKSKRNHGAPKGLASFVEPLVLFVKDDIAAATIGKNYNRYLPYLLTLFFFILINNLLGLLPGAANVTGNIAITFILSFITLIITNLSANKNYWSHIFKPPGVPAILLPIMIPIEIVGIFSKPFALMIRLFANISAGHIIILSLISLIFMAQAGLGTIGAYSVAPISVIFVLFMYLIECLVAFLQAYIFTLLTSLFIGLAVAEDH